MKIHFLPYIILFVIFLSCVDKKNINETVLYPFEISPSKPSFNSIKFIALETDSINLLSGDLRIKFSENNIYVADLKVHESIFRFDKMGNYLNKIGTKGKGPNEYIRLKDFTIKLDTIDILSGAGSKTYITGFKSDGTFLYKREFEIIAFSFEYFQGNYLFYTSYNKAFHPYRIYLADNLGKTIKTFLPNNNNLNLPVEENNFFGLDSILVFKEAFNNTIYTYYKNNVNPTYSLNFGKYTIPDKFFKMKLMEGFELINKNGFGNIRNCYENASFIVFDVNVQKQDEFSIYHFIYNKNTQRSKLIAYKKDEISIFKNLISLTKENELVYLVFPEEIIEKQEEMKSFYVENPQMLSSFNENSNPILAFCKINLD